MVADAPMIVYTHGKKTKPSKREIEEKMKQWQQRNADRGEKILISDIINNKR